MNIAKKFAFFSILAGLVFGVEAKRKSSYEGEHEYYYWMTNVRVSIADAKQKFADYNPAESVLNLSSLENDTTKMADFVRSGETSRPTDSVKNSWNITITNNAHFFRKLRITANELFLQTLGNPYFVGTQIEKILGSINEITHAILGDQAEQF